MCEWKWASEGSCVSLVGNAETLGIDLGIYLFIFSSTFWGFCISHAHTLFTCIYVCVQAYTYMCSILTVFHLNVKFPHLKKSIPLLKVRSCMYWDDRYHCTRGWITCGVVSWCWRQLCAELFRLSPAIPSKMKNSLSPNAKFDLDTEHVVKGQGAISEFICAEPVI